MNNVLTTWGRGLPEREYTILWKMCALCVISFIAEVKLFSQRREKVASFSFSELIRHTTKIYKYGDYSLYKHYLCLISIYKAL